jgi:3-phenylpropionate/cinnamic acid dioxygenase small subunit
MAAAFDLALLTEVQQFIFREARFQDEHQYDAWEALWTDDGTYWIPANSDDMDPDSQMSIIYDNRSRIAIRIKQFQTGKRHSQSPRSRLRRVVSNIEILNQQNDELLVTANAFIYEANSRGETVWATRNDYALRRQGEELRMARKKVVLVNNERALFTLSFLI